MKVTHISIGKAEPLKANPEVTTGLYKRPVDDAVKVGSLGLEGDAICNTKDHGGVDQAVYVYTQPDLDWWSKCLNYPIPAGTFGENLLFDGLESADVLIGDRFQIGDVLLEVTSPRIPCSTFALRMTGAHFLKEFIVGRRPGFYCRVLKEGSIAAGDGVAYLPWDGPKLSIGEMFDHYYNKDLSTSEMERYLDVPVHHKARAQMEEALAAE